MTDRRSIVLAYAGVYSSFLLHAERVAKRYEVPGHNILTEVGRHVGGQEDMIADITMELASKRSTPARVAADGSGAA
jgi:hypothetical protein